MVRRAAAREREEQLKSIYPDILTPEAWMAEELAKKGSNKSDVSFFNVLSRSWFIECRDCASSCYTVRLNITVIFKSKISSLQTTIFLRVTALSHS